MSRPKLLDLFCCEGGASMGYHRAGFDVYGVDLFKDYSQKRYPFPSVRADVIWQMESLMSGHPAHFNNGESLRLVDFAVKVASPPCQHASAGTRAQDRSKYPRLIEPTRELLQRDARPYVIENVKGADLIDPIMLCGTMFGLSATDDDGTPLEMWRHRLFESNADIAPPALTWLDVRGPELGKFPGQCRHGWYSEQVAGSYGGARRDKDEARNVRHGGYVPSKKVQQELLGIDWMTERGMHQSIPPAYTEHVGRQLLASLSDTGSEAAA